MPTSPRLGVALLLALLLAPALLARGSLVPVGDVEGQFSHWKTLAKLRLLRFDGEGTPGLAPGEDELLFLGDLMRRGPFGKRTVEWVGALTRNHPERVVAVLGNHDINPVAFLALRPSLELGAIRDYEEDRAARGAASTLGDQLDWWARKFEVQDKLRNWWIELAAEAAGQPPLSQAFWRRITREDAEGKRRVSEEALEAILPREAMAGAFLAFYSPGGAGWDLLERTPLLRALPRGEKRWLIMHSGQPSQGNLGVVPGHTARVFDEVPGRGWVDQWARLLEEDFKRPQLAKLAEAVAAYEAAPEGSDAAREAARQARELYLRKYGDAGWDEVLETLEYVGESVVYPDKRVHEHSSVPGLPVQEVTDRLAAAGVELVLGGHVPVGDGILVRVGHSEHGVVRYLMLDTSYSPVEGQQRVRLLPDGGILARITSRDGLRIVVDLPSEARIAELLAAPEDSPERWRGQQMRRIGRVLDGQMVVGFAAQPDSWEPDYDQLVLLRQEGYAFTYTAVGKWGVLGALEKYPDGQLPEARSDLQSMVAEAYEGRREMLRKYGKEDLSDTQLIARLRGRKVYVSSGPAASSFGKVKADPGGAARAAGYLKAWRAWLEGLPAQESWVFLGGGTTGLEAAKNALVAEVSAARRARGARPFEILGAITGLTGGSELDPAVQAFGVTRAYYWRDYFPELLKLLAKVAPRQDTAVTIEFAGGGSILAGQIDEALAFQETFPQVEVRLVEGVHADGAPAATEKAIQALGARTGRVQVSRVRAAQPVP